MPKQTRTAIDTPPAAQPAADPATIGAREAQRTLGDLLARVRWGRERITITRHGKTIAALVSVEDLERLDGAA